LPRRPCHSSDARRCSKTPQRITRSPARYVHALPSRAHSDVGPVHATDLPHDDVQIELFQLKNHYDDDYFLKVQQGAVEAARDLKREVEACIKLGSDDKLQRALNLMGAEYRARRMNSKGEALQAQLVWDGICRWLSRCLGPIPAAVRGTEAFQGLLEALDVKSDWHQQLYFKHKEDIVRQHLTTTSIAQKLTRLATEAPGGLSRGRGDPIQGVWRRICARTPKSRPRGKFICARALLSFRGFLPFLSPYGLRAELSTFLKQQEGQFYTLDNEWARLELVERRRSPFHNAVSSLQLKWVPIEENPRPGSSGHRRGSHHGDRGNVKRARTGETQLHNLGQGAFGLHRYGEVERSVHFPVARWM
jgi:hypothetical protein